MGPYEVGRHLSSAGNGWIKLTNNKEWKDGYIMFLAHDEVMEVYINPLTIEKILVGRNRYAPVEKDTDTNWDYLVTNPG